MSDTVYRFSEKRLTYTKQVAVFMGFLVPVFLAASMFFATLVDESLQKGIFFILLIPVVLFFELTLAGVFSLVIGQFRKRKLLVSSQFIERSLGKAVERITYNEIEKIQLYETPEGELVLGIIYSNNSTFSLGGFDDMNAMLTQIAQNLDDQSRIERIVLKKKFSNWLIFGFALLVGLALPILLLIWGANAYIPLLLVPCGLYLLIYRPFSRSVGGDLANFEIGMGILVIVLSVGFTLIRIIS